MQAARWHRLAPVQGNAEARPVAIDNNVRLSRCRPAHRRYQLTAGRSSGGTLPACRQMALRAALAGSGAVFERSMVPPDGLLVSRSLDWDRLHGEYVT